MDQQDFYIVEFLIVTLALIQTYVQLRTSKNNTVNGGVVLYLHNLSGIAFSAALFVPYIQLMDFIFHYPYAEPNRVILKTISALVIIAFLFFVRTAIKTYKKDFLVLTKEKKYTNSFSNYKLMQSTRYSASSYSLFSSLSLGAYISLLYSNGWNERPIHLSELGKSPERQEYLASLVDKMPTVLPTLLIALLLITGFQLFMLSKTKKNEKKMASFDELTSHLDQIYKQLIADWQSIKQQNALSFERFALIDQFSSWDKDRYDQITLENSRMYEESKKVLEATRYWRADDCNHFSMMASSLGIIRGLSAEEEMLAKIENVKEVLSDKTFESSGNSVEIDAIVVNDEGVHLIELKNIRADEIIIEPSGVAYRIVRNEKYRMDDLFSQVGRARDIIRDIVGPKVNIYNVIVFANKETQITTRLESENLQVIDLGYLSFIFQNKQYSHPLNDEIVNKLLNAQIPERKYDFYNIFSFKKELIKAYKHDILVYDDWYVLHEKELDEIKNYQLHINEKLQNMIQNSKISKNLKNTLIEKTTEIIQDYFKQEENAIVENLNVPKENVENEVKRLNYGIDVLISDTVTNKN